MLNSAAERKRIADLHKAGLEKLVSKEYEGALMEFRCALVLDPDNPVTLFLFATCLSTLGQFDEAEPSAHRAAEIAPGLPGVHVLLASILAARERYAEAESKLIDALVLDPRNHLAHVELGRLLLKQDRFGEARARLGHALQIAPNDAEGLLLLGITCTLEHDFETAATALLQVLEVEPKNEQALALYGYVCLSRGYRMFRTPPKLAEYNKGVAALRAALEINPSNEIAQPLLQEAEGMIERINAPTGGPRPDRWYTSALTQLMVWGGMAALAVGMFALIVWLDESYGSESLWTFVIVTCSVYLMSFLLMMFLKKEFHALPPSIFNFGERIVERFAGGTRKAEDQSEP
jgi:Flp pilus assembly protein TadD